MSAFATVQSLGGGSFKAGHSIGIRKPIVRKKGAFLIFPKGRVQYNAIVSVPFRAIKEKACGVPAERATGFKLERQNALNVSQYQVICFVFLWYLFCKAVNFIVCFKIAASKAV